MAERFTGVFTLQRNLYRRGSPVILAGGRLLKDTQTGKILGQLKFVSVSQKPIKAISVILKLRDVAGAALGQDVSWQYLDFLLNCGQDYGSQEPVTIPDQTARGFVPVVSKVIFADNSVWENSTAFTETIPEQKQLRDVINDAEEEQEFRKQAGTRGPYYPQYHQDLLQCACGAVCKDTELTCPSCGADLARLFNVSLSDVRKAVEEHHRQMEEAARRERERREREEAERRAREEAERKAAEEAERLRREEEEKAKARARKRRRRIFVVFMLLAFLTAGLYGFWHVYLPDRYAQAQALLGQGKYDEAVEIFSKISYYRDSGNQVLAVNREYDRAIALMNQGKYEEAMKAFQNLIGYKDSAAQITACETVIKDEAYEAAAALQAAGQYTEAMAAYKALNGHRDSAAQITACETAIKDEAYEAATALQTAGQYTEAIAAYKALNGHRDSAAQITVCETAIKDEAYESAAALQAAGQYTEAITAYKALNGYRDSAVQITACETAISDEENAAAYEAAAALMKSGKYAEAYAAYVQLKGYKDVDTLLATDENLKAAAAAAAREAFIAQLYVGNTVTMGYYGGEAVEWLVLAAEGDTRTMIAVKGQDAVCFNKNYSDGNKWETSYIRTWLNDTYYNETCSGEEQAMLIAGPTGDKVWLLSVDEAEQYFANDEARVCYPSAYAKQKGAYTDSSGAGWWWLRSPGSDSSSAAGVDGIGYVFSDGYYVYLSDGLARPVVAVSVAAGVSSGFTKS